MQRILHLLGSGVINLYFHFKFVEMYLKAIYLLHALRMEMVIHFGLLKLYLTHIQMWSILISL